LSSSTVTPTANKVKLLSGQTTKSGVPQSVAKSKGRCKVSVVREGDGAPLAEDRADLVQRRSERLVVRLGRGRELSLLLRIGRMREK
jgi:hypothetical protein